ncbi:UNVERIFIED_CONTAM: hypothetical protein FKN15_043016 [Acipenser sinensis]
MLLNFAMVPYPPTFVPSFVFLAVNMQSKKKMCRCRLLIINFCTLRDQWVGTACLKTHSIGYC